MHRGVYAVGYPTDTLDARFMAAVLAGGRGAFLCSWASCALAGLVRLGWPSDRRTREQARRDPQQLVARLLAAGAPLARSRRNIA